MEKCTLLVPDSSATHSLSEFLPWPSSGPRELSGD